jgi:hypothetical protein
MERHRPRHIRDIAHLYVSRMRKPEHGRRLRLIVAGADRSCFPGFHTANLAVALAASGCAVRLLETSGLQPNAGFFLALPPDVYLDGPALDAGGARAPSASALFGVDIAFGLGGAPAEASAGRAAVEVIHAPPAEFESAWREAAAASVEGFTGPVAVVVLDGAGGAGRRLLAGLPDPARGYVLRVAGLRGASAAGDIRDLGTVDRWHPALTDRVPPHVRDPESHLARAYRSVAEYILAETRFDDVEHGDGRDQPRAGVYREVTRRGASAAFTRPR